MLKDSTVKLLEEADVVIGRFGIEGAIEVPDAEKLTKDMKTKIIELDNPTKAEIRTLVDTFYQLQDDRKAKTEQIRSIKSGADQTGENKEVTVALLEWVCKNMAAMEAGIKKSLELICETDPVGKWLLDTRGIGPVLAAGLLAYFDVEDREYSSQFISYAGLNDNNRPWLGKEKSKAMVDEIVGDSKTITDEMVYKIANKTQWSYDHIRNYAWDEKKSKWKKAEIIKACSMIPYNRGAKTHMWKVGKSFWWMKNDEKSMYGKLYSERRAYEQARNDAGDYADQAARILETKNFDKATNAYKAYAKGELPTAHLDARAMRWVEKIFLSHLFEEMYRVRYNKIPPRYYALAHFEEHHNNEILPEVPYTKVSGEM